MQNYTCIKDVILMLKTVNNRGAELQLGFITAGGVNETRVNLAHFLCSGNSRDKVSQASTLKHKIFRPYRLMSICQQAPTTRIAWRAPWFKADILHLNAPNQTLTLAVKFG